MAIKVEVGNTRSIKVVINGSKQRAKIGSAVGRNPLKVFGQYLNTVYQFALATLGIDEFWFFDNEDGGISTVPTIEVQMLKSGTLDVDFYGQMEVNKISGPGNFFGDGIINAVAGVCQFDNFIDANGEYVVEFTSGTATPVQATFNSFTREWSFNDSALDSIIDETAPPFIVTVTRDSGTGTDTDCTSDVTLFRIAGPIPSAGTLVKACVAGIATFDDLVFDEEGTTLFVVTIDTPDITENPIISYDTTTGAVEIVTENLIQHIAKPDGLDIYEDITGINVQDGWFLPDNVANRQLRTIQPGRGYGFTGVESAQFGGVDTAFSCQDLELEIIVKVTGNDSSYRRLYGIHHNDSSGGIGFQRLANAVGIRITYAYSTGLRYINPWKDNVVFGKTFHIVWTVVSGNWTIKTTELTTGEVYEGSGIITNGAIRWNNYQSYLGEDASTAGKSTETLYKFKLTNNDAAPLVMFDFNCDESAGLVSYDASGNGNDGTIALGGSAESSFHITDNGVPSVQNLLGFNKAGYFDGVRYGRINEITTIPRDFSFSFSFIYYDVADNLDLIDLSDIPNPWTESALTLYVLGTKRTTFTVHGDRVTDNQIWSEWLIGEENLVEISCISDVVILSINGVQKINEAITYTNVSGNSIIIGGTNYDVRGTKAIRGVKLIDLTGAPIELINLDWANSNDTIVPNIGTDAPADSDMTWVTDSAHLLIPVDQSIPTKDVLGNTLPSTHVGQVRYETQVKDSSVGNFDNVLYGVIGYLIDFDVLNFEINIEFIADDITPIEIKTLFSWSLNSNTASGWASGGRIYVNVSGLVGTFITTSTTTKTGFASTGAIVSGLNTVQLKNYSSSGIEITLNGNLNSGSYITPFYQRDEDTLIGSQLNGTTYNQRYEGEIIKITFHELNSSGDRINELINLNFSEVNGLVVHNIAADAPASSNMAWVLGGSSDGTQWGVSDLQYPKNLIEGYQLYQKTGKYDIFVPVGVTVDSSITTLGYTKTGDITGDGETINTAESVYDRNPKDAPELVLAGIPQAEDIGYEDITGDISRFYDDSGVEIIGIANALVYDDFPEPIAGSVFQGDNNLYLQHPNLTVITITSWQGTATPIKSGNNILVTTGTLLELILSDGSKYVFSEEKGLTCYDLLKQNDLTVILNGSSAGSQWTLLTNKDYHHNKKYGYNDNGTSLVPGDPNNAGFDVNGDPIDNQAEVTKYNEISASLNR